MYFFYIDESGEKNPKVKPDEPFVLIGLALYEHRWNRFDMAINDVKRDLLEKVYQKTQRRFDLADVEAHSSVIRQPKLRSKDKFFKHVSDEELTTLVETFYDQLGLHHITLFAVVIDKRSLHSHFDLEKCHRKAYELLLERFETYLSIYHPKHNGIIIVDSTTKQEHRSLAMKHAYFMATGTSAGVRLKHIIEQPLFVNSRFSNGVQLADLCAYNIFHAFKYSKLDYPYFKRILPYIQFLENEHVDRFEGLKVFPDESKWIDIVNELIKRRPALLKQALK